MGIDLSLLLRHSLRVVTDSEPEPGAAPRPTAVSSRELFSDLASARSFVPDTWWSMVEPADAQQGPYGLVFVVPCEVALRRLEAAAPLWRAAGGRHVLGLRDIEARMRQFPDGFVHVELHELYEASTPASWDWVRPQAHRVRKNPGHGGTFAQELVGLVPGPSIVEPIVHDLAASPGDLSGLERHIEAAAMANDPSHVDLLEEALARHCSPFQAWLPIVRPLWKQASSRTGAPPDLSAVVHALASGQTDPFAPARALSPEVAAPALFAVGARIRSLGLNSPQRRALWKTLASSSEPLAAPLALGYGRFSESLEGLYLAEWLHDGTPSPGSSRRSILARRLAAIGTEEPLSLADPAAWVERVVHGDFAGNHSPADTTSWDAEYAVRRALSLSRGQVTRWHRERKCASLSEELLALDGSSDPASVTPDLEAMARTVCLDVVEAVARLEHDLRKRLMAVAVPEDAFLQGATRSAVRLALGRAAELEGLPLDDPSLPLGLAIGASRMAPLPWSALERRVAARDFDAAALLLASDGGSPAARQASTALLPDALRKAQRSASDYDEGIITSTERNAAIRKLARFANALGPEGAELRLLLVAGDRGQTAIP